MWIHSTFCLKNKNPYWLLINPLRKLNFYLAFKNNQNFFIEENIIEEKNALKKGKNILEILNKLIDSQHYFYFSDQIPKAK